MVKRGEVWWAEYPEPAGRRPVVIVQSDKFNRSAIRTVLAVPMTTNLALADAPGNVRLSAADTGLPKDSVANVSQLGVLSKAALGTRVAALSGRHLARIEQGLRLILELA
jgi:mRNA interferase MazF